MQPINYSLILNIAMIAVCAWLAYVFSQPMLVIIALLAQTHALERFHDHDNEDTDAQPMGFTADLKK